MDPWDIDVTVLTQKYIGLIKKMQEHDLLVSGKILLAAALLLKMKSSHLIDNDIAKLDSLINPVEDDMEEEFWDDVSGSPRRKNQEQYTLIPRNPQPRNRKVSITDLVDALQRAMATKKRILSKQKPTRFKMPAHKVDIMEVIRDIYHKITFYSNKEKKKTLTFTRLLPPKASKKDKVYTFLPLLHLENEHKITTHQKKSFSEIEIQLLNKKNKKSSKAR